MLVVDKLLGSHEVAQRIVACTLDSTDAVAPAICETTSYSPSVLHDARIVGVHGTGVVTAVGKSYRRPLSRSKAAGTEIVVARAAQGAHAVGVALEGQRCLAESRLVVQTAHKGVTELSAFHIVHGIAVDVHIVVLGIQRTVFEAYGRETVAHLVGINVAV